MAVLLDSNVIIAFLNSRDKNHTAAKELLTKLKHPEYGMRVTIDYVLDEVLTALWMHTRRKDVVKKAHRFIRNTPEFIRFDYVKSDIFDLAWRKWEKVASWPKKPLSFTDSCILSFMERHDIEYLASFDSDFDGLVSLVLS